ncbi:MAG: hypothetical protein ABFR97_05550 [Thermodesulfobacteriota bacterium]
MKAIQSIIEQIKNLEKQLSIEIQKKEDEFFYKIHGKKIDFEESTRRYHKTLATKIHTYLINAAILNILTAPFVWFCLIPLILLDIVVSTYQFICFPAYRIPKVRRNDYIIVDRYALKYLNAFEKLNCIYCGYANGMIAYIQEIAARTEQYWCPIKHARKVGRIHSRYKYFLEYGDGANYKDALETIRRDFKDID